MKPITHIYYIVTFSIWLVVLICIIRSEEFTMRNKSLLLLQQDINIINNDDEIIGVLKENTTIVYYPIRNRRYKDSSWNAFVEIDENYSNYVTCTNLSSEDSFYYNVRTINE